MDRRLGADAADDIAAETFLVAFRKRAGFDSAQGSVRSWLYGIATRLVSRHRRNEVRRYRAIARVGADPAVEGPEDRVAAQVAASAAGGRLGAALAGLSSGDRDVLLLVAFGDLTYEEVAGALGIAYGTVCSRLSRARRKLRAALGGTDPSAHRDEVTGRGELSGDMSRRDMGVRDMGVRDIGVRDMGVRDVRGRDTREEGRRGQSMRAGDEGGDELHG